MNAAPAVRHSAFDDAQGLLTGTLFVALALVLFRHAGLVTGGTAGLAFIVHYALGLPFGLAFFAINLPFYALAWKRMGPRFTLKTFAAVALLSGLAEAVPRWVVLQSVQPLFAALGGGLLMGAGLLILFRHRASLGGAQRAGAVAAGAPRLARRPGPDGAGRADPAGRRALGRPLGVAAVAAGGAGAEPGAGRQPPARPLRRGLRRTAHTGPGLRV